MDRTTDDVNPFLKWPGGKRWLSADIATLIRESLQGVYYEPFLGSGAVFFKLRPSKACLSDLNADLIATYRTVRDDSERVVETLRRLRPNASEYHRIRASKPRSNVRRAARFIYLNRLCYGGLFRVNRHGHFNVPYHGGGRSHLPFLNRGVIIDASSELRNTTVLACDFEPVIDTAEYGDVVYCDPAYTTPTARVFDRYHRDRFVWADQVRLADCARRAVQRGATVIVSGAAAAELVALYDGADVFEYQRENALNISMGREKARELLIRLRPGMKGTRRQELKRNST